MLTILLDPEAQDDLRLLAVTDPLVITRFTAFVEQARSDPDLLHALTTHSFNAANIEVMRWIEQHNNDRAIWRLRFCCFGKRRPDYRVFYCIGDQRLSDKRSVVHILGIKKREEIDYDDSKHPISQRIISAYARYTSRPYK